MTKPPPPPPFGKATQPPAPETTESKGLDVAMRSQYQPEWRARLHEAGYPETVVVIDFESFFDTEYSLKKMSTIEYIMDERFEILGASTVEMNQPFTDYELSTVFDLGQAAVENRIKHLQREYGEDLAGCTIVTMNATFDLGILAYRYGIHPAYHIDILGLARHWESRTSNKLGDLCERLGLDHKGDTMQFKEMTFKRRFKTPKGRGKAKMPIQLPAPTDELIEKLRTYTDNDVMREWEVFILMLPLLSDPSRELWVMQHTIELYTKPVLEVDYERGETLAVEMDEQVDKACDAAGYVRKEISGNISFEAIFKRTLQEAGEDPDDFYKEGKKAKKDGSHGWSPAVAKEDPQRELLLYHENKQVRLVTEARVAIKSWPNHSKRVRSIMAQARAAGGKLPVSLKYCGAHTLRWSGSEGINLQNLGARSEEELVRAVRELLIAPEGCVLAIDDAAQIEARILAWLAGEDWLVEKFEQDVEIYSEFATKVLGVYVRKPVATDPPPVQALLKYRRNAVGKTGILGCGYGMGGAKVVGYTKGAVDLEMGNQIVKVYRDEHPAIVQFWKDIEKAFIYTAKWGKPCELRGLKFHSQDNCDVVITLPSGRELKYHQVKIVRGKFDKPAIRVYNAQTRSWGHVWGGHLTENVVQAISRDLLSDAIYSQEQNGFHVVHHVHDEIITCVPEDQGEEAHQAALSALSVRPEWGPGLPLGAEGLVTKRYGGH